jgi:hypothetical protein
LEHGHCFFAAAGHAAARAASYMHRHGDRVMSKPLVISIPHKLGQQEARRRLELSFSHAGRSFAA